MGSLIRDRKFLHATAVLIGTMVGVGMFGVPFVFAKSGFLIGVATLLGVSALTLLFNLLFAELTLRTQGAHQLPGYANIWLGSWGRRAVFFANVLGIYGALLAYLIVVGEFLRNIFAQVSAIDPSTYSMIFAIVASLFLLARLRTVAAIEFTMVIVLVGVLLLVFVTGFPSIQMSHFSGWNSQYWFLPYGVIMFALAGLTSVPIMRQLLMGRERLLRPSITWAVALVALLYLLFAFVVVGVSGADTSPEALSGLFGHLGTPIIILGSILGVMTISTSYLMLGTALSEIYGIDYRLRPMSAWLLTVLPPLIFFWTGLRNFIDVIGMVGAVAIGIESAIFLFAYLRAKRFSLRTPEWHLTVPKSVIYLLALLFLAGSGYALIIQ